jgi:hypothetical protein
MALVDTASGRHGLDARGTLAQQPAGTAPPIQKRRRCIGNATSALEQP